MQQMCKGVHTKRLANGEPAIVLTIGAGWEIISSCVKAHANESNLERKRRKEDHQQNSRLLDVVLYDRYRRETK